MDWMQVQYEDNGRQALYAIGIPKTESDREQYQWEKVILSLAGFNEDGTKK